MSSLKRNNLPGQHTSAHRALSPVGWPIPGASPSFQPGRPLLYKKPAAICDPTDEFLPLLWKGKDTFQRIWTQQITHYLDSCGLQIKLIEDVDSLRIKEFLERRYEPELAKEICVFDLFRFRNFGHGAILIDKKEQVQGSIFEVGYDTEEKTSYTLRLAIAEEWEGKNLAWNLVLYSSLQAMGQGSRVKRGIIQFENQHSLYINLNKVGWICDKFEPTITGLGAFFHIALPLDPAGLTGNRINIPRTLEFIKGHKEGTDYRLIDCSDMDAIANMYEKTSFKIVAMLKAGILGDASKFLAIPAEHLQLKSPPGSVPTKIP